jgi:hypothetical protein
VALIMKRTLLYLIGALGLYVRVSAPSMALPTSQAVAAKWKQRTAAASQDYLDGVAQTDKDPTALAIQAGPRLLDNFTKAFTSGKWANGLRRTGKAGWQAAVAAKGGTNFSNGVNAAEAKVADAFAPLLAFEQNLLNTVSAMPNVTDNDREQRMLAWVRGMRQFQKS